MATITMAGASSKENQLNKKAQQEMITPYRLSVAILIRSYLKYREQDDWLHITDIERVKCRREFNVLALNLLQGPDLKLIELKQLLQSSSHLEAIQRIFFGGLQDIYSGSIGSLLDAIDSLKQIMSFNDLSQSENKSLLGTSGMVSKNSVIGYFFRRFIMYFEKLTFSEVSGVYQAFIKYFNDWKKTQQALEGSTEIMKVQELNIEQKQWPRRQAELFLATQAVLLQNDQERALPPRDLQTKISSILKSNPDLAEAHFLSYLNYLRVEEFCGAMQSLFHCFDRKTNPDIKCYNDEKSKEYRYAALNLAILYHHFGHRKEALASLREAIKIAQEANDSLCLQHALSWLYRLSNINKDNSIVQCIIKTFELNQNYTTSLAIQNFTHFASAKVCLRPSDTFEILTESDMLNCENNYTDLAFNNNAMKASLWQLYGKTDMCSLWSQTLLYLNIDARNDTVYYGEGYLYAVCNVAQIMLLQGEYSLVNTIINYIKRKYPNEPHSLTWMFVENVAVFTRAFYNEKWSVAESAAQKITVLDKFEGFLKLAELYFFKQEYEEAERYIYLIMKNYDQEQRLNDGKFCHLRAKILLSEVHFAANYPNSCNAMLTLTECLTETKKSNLAYYTSLVYLHIAHVLLTLGLSDQAIQILRDPKCMVEILANGGYYDKARATLLYVKCLIADSSKLDRTKQHNVIVEAAKCLEEVKEDFKKVEAFSRMKDVLYLQGNLYNSLNMKTERNSCALEYRLLDEEYKSKNVQTLVKYL